MTSRRLTPSWILLAVRAEFPSDCPRTLVRGYVAEMRNLRRGFLWAVLAGVLTTTCAACGSTPPVADGVVRGRVVVVGSAFGHAPDTAGKFLLIGSDGSTIRVPVGPRGLYLAHVPPGTYGVGGQVDSYYGSNLACSTEPSTFRVTSKRTTTVPVGCGLP